MFALLNVNKQAGVSSRQVVDVVQRLARPAKVGHAGTLDPLATGVLVLCLGPATRLIDRVQQLKKEYRATFLLGRSSESDDTERELVLHPQHPQPGFAEIAAALPQFLGRIEQRPPAFSAVKVAGRRAYKLARAGEEVVITPRPVEIYSLEIVRYEYPELVLDISCGSGTYVRSLGRDLAISLGTAAVMSALVRTAIGPFRVDEGHDVAALTKENLAEHCLSPLVALQNLPAFTASEEEVARLRNGLRIALPDCAEEYQEAAIVDAAGRLVSIVRKKGNELAPVKTFPNTAG